MRRNRHTTQERGQPKLGRLTREARRGGMYPFHERYCIRFYDEASGRLAGIWWRNNGRLLTPWGDLGRFPSPIQAVQALTMRRARFVGNLSEGKGG